MKAKLLKCMECGQRYINACTYKNEWLVFFTTERSV
jgi:hypothetical protein